MSNSLEKEWTFPDVQTVTLRQIEHGWAERIEKCFFPGKTSFEILQDRAEFIEYHLRVYLLADDRDFVKVIYHPKDWLEAAKERFAPKWILKRWPVKYTEHKISFEVLYPNFRPSIPEQEYKVNIKVYQNERLAKSRNGDIHCF